MNNWIKILATIGYVYFGFIHIIASMRDKYYHPKGPRFPTVYMRDSTIDFALNWSCCMWIMWQTCLELVKLWFN